MWLRWSHQTVPERLFVPLAIEADAIQKQTWGAADSVLNPRNKIAADSSRCVSFFSSWRNRLRSKVSSPRSESNPSSQEPVAARKAGCAFPRIYPAPPPPRPLPLPAARGDGRQKEDIAGTRSLTGKQNPFADHERSRTDAAIRALVITILDERIGGIPWTVYMSSGRIGSNSRETSGESIRASRQVHSYDVQKPHALQP